MTGSQWRHFKQAEWFIAITFCKDLYGCSRKNASLSHIPHTRGDRKLSVITPACLLLGPFSLLLHELEHFTSSHLQGLSTLLLITASCIHPLATVKLKLLNLACSDCFFISNGPHHLQSEVQSPSQVRIFISWPEAPGHVLVLFIL